MEAKGESSVWVCGPQSRETYVGGACGETDLVQGVCNRY